MCNIFVQRKRNSPFVENGFEQNLPEKRAKGKVVVKKLMLIF